MTGKLLIKSILVWTSALLWAILLSVEGGTFKPIATTLVLATLFTWAAVKTVSYEEFKIISGYSWFCKKFNIKDEEE